MDKVLTERQHMTLRRALNGRLVVLCFGAVVKTGSPRPYSCSACAGPASSA
ncbi:hypothetical protein [Azohydromonas lata]|uniref:hypothetical protein n=1 Tax=Azohydromonas lata TaxID=45677 RepID=UPI0012F4AECF|nr:hypothetical protein [Azohydromonas lata]